ncbi:MAG: hypothetical protein ACHQC8_03845 [Solirubrobacterales bacterium]
MRCISAGATQEPSGNVDRAAALRELGKPVPASSSVPTRRELTADPLHGLNMRLTYRTLKVLAVIAARPGLSNI